MVQQYGSRADAMRNIDCNRDRTQADCIGAHQNQLFAEVPPLHT
jgi:hypothetical protein